MKAMAQMPKRLLRIQCSSIVIDIVNLERKKNVLLYQGPFSHTQNVVACVRSYLMVKYSE